MSHPKPKTNAEKCDVPDCSEPSVRSMHTGKVKGALGLELGGDGKTAHLCREHYKQFKKATKEERTLERLAY